MPANTVPIFPLTPKIAWGTDLLAPITDKTGASSVSVMTAGANGSRVDYLRIRTTGVFAASVVRIWINNGASKAVATNNVLFDEVTFAVTALNEAAATIGQTIQLDLALPAGYQILVANGTAGGGAGVMQVSAVYGDY
jgi:hypothetical protein